MFKNGIRNSKVNKSSRLNIFQAVFQVLLEVHIVWHLPRQPLGGYTSKVRTAASRNLKYFKQNFEFLRIILQKKIAFFD